MLVADPPRGVLNPPCTHNPPNRISTGINYVVGHLRRRAQPANPVQPASQPASQGEPARQPRCSGEPAQPAKSAKLVSQASQSSPASPAAPASPVSHEFIKTIEEKTNIDL